MKAIKKPNISPLETEIDSKVSLACLFMAAAKCGQLKAGHPNQLTPSSREGDPFTIKNK
ncbi:hypothetical protein HQ865_22775 [Mucilaginibacter mali]|uniref:Uncharacterized protein n=1 Tax=Mucilaginibacter mali TaxID=2740462 RepID=A0A7D4Q6Q4_9SPHI|nr:hypothetical protein [Mucilaginibacter mali]QKJ32467.1 hypothetical protein HQ865_22775 [Mucilaginibacter mali]